MQEFMHVQTQLKLSLFQQQKDAWVQAKRMALAQIDYKKAFSVHLQNELVQHIRQHVQT